MGPQHPSTHGVLRLILEIDGETVTEARCGIGYLHTGIEKNLEYRTWTQGTTFVTRMDYLTPFFNETAYCLGVEKLLGIEDQIPDRANVIRVLLMELNRLSSHLVCIATGGMELGATTVMIYGFRDRELILDLYELITGLRMNHAYIRPGGLAQDLPPGAVDPMREFVKKMRKNLPGVRQARHREPHLQGPYAGRRLPRPRRLHGARRHRPDPALHRPAARPAQGRSPYCGYETYDFEVPTADTCDSYGRFLIRLEEMRQSLRIVEQCLDRLEPGPGHGRRQEDRLARAARARPRRARQLPRPHQEDHGHLHGGPDPPLQAGHRGLPGPAGPGVRGRRVAQGRARRARRSATAAPAPTGSTSATPPSPTCRPWRRCARAARSPTSSSPSRPSTP